MAVVDACGPSRHGVWRSRGSALDLSTGPAIMGILNVTPDSFSDGGRLSGPAQAAEAAVRLVAEGADLLDLGGESTRPGATSVDKDEELRRVLPALEQIRERVSVPISIDTMKADVAERAVGAGANIINDVWGLQKDPDMARVAADTGAGLIVMHNRERVNDALDVVEDVLGFLSRSIDIALAASIPHERIAVDPGIGFGKTARQSAEMIRRLDELSQLGFPILLGASRKRFIGTFSGVDEAAKRVHGTLAAHIAGVLAGASIVRVHDVAAHHQAFGVLAAVRSR